MTDRTLRRVALISGGNRGLGLAIARRLAEHGLHVVIGTRDELSGRDAVEALSKEGLDARSHQLDVTDPASVARAVADVANSAGRLDVLVNNAAVAIDRKGSGRRSTPTSSARGGSARPLCPRCARTATAASSTSRAISAR